MEKKGQISIFIVIGIILLLISGIVIFQMKIIKNAPLQKPPEQDFSRQVTLYIERCISKTNNEALHVISRQAGYYFPDKYVGLAYSVPFYFYYGNKTIPNITRVESELAQYVEENIDYCIDNFFPLKTLGIEFEDAIPKATVKLTKKEIITTLYYPIKAMIMNTSVSFTNFAASTKTDFLDKFSILMEFASEQGKIPNYEPIGAFTRLAYENNITYYSDYVSDDTVVYTIYFNDTTKTSIFSFASQYNWSNLRGGDTILNETPNSTIT